jgi:hypothetical protein
MTLLALMIKAHTGVRLGEVGEVLGAIGGLALLLGGLTPFGRRAGQAVGGLALAVGFVLLIIATHWGHFH